MTWLINGQILDVHSGNLQLQHIRVDGHCIAELSRERPRSTQLIIDLAGAFVLPGMFDCHVHICADSHNPDATHGWGDALPGAITLYAARSAKRMLMAGITTARDVGGWDYHEIAVRNAIEKGWIEGPRLVCAGRILTITSSTTPYYRGMYEEADGADAVRKAARLQFARGAQFLKILASGAVTSSEYENPLATQYQPAEIEAAVGIARDNLSYVAAHAHSPQAIRHAVQGGCRSIEHTVYGEESVYRMMVERGTYLVPTLCVTHAMLSDPNFSVRVPKHLRERYEQIQSTHATNIKLAKRLGVKLAMGSDAGTPGNHCGDNLQELEVMVREGGLSTLEAIQTATINAARLMRLDGEAGSIEIGKRADLIAVSKNPLDEISIMRAVLFVMKAGTIYKSMPESSGPPS